MPVALALSGPTGSGKSALAMQLAGELPLEIVSVDSMLVYRGMDIGTAKPDARERALVPHHLIDIRDPAQVYSAGEFAHDARALLDDIHARGRTPLLVGGTLLYFRALLEGLAEMPRASPQVRAQLDAQAAEQGWPAMHAMLAQIDAAAAARIHPNDAQRIQRALEIHRTTGRTATELHRAPHVKATDTAWSFASFVLLPADRNLLHERLATRFDTMMDAGFLAEVEQLHMRGDLTVETPAIRAVGYRQLWEYLQGQCTLPVARARAVAATRQLAKRQLTWLRSQPAPEGTHALEAFAAGTYERFRSAVLQTLR